MSKSNLSFTKMVDDLVEFSGSDPELAHGIRWLDNQAQKKGITFYDMVFEVLYKHGLDSSTTHWMSSKS